MYDLHATIAKRVLMPALLICAGASGLHAQAAKITNGEQLIRAMHERYAGKWYKTVTFVQNTATTEPDGSVKNATWYESASLPGKLRIDFEPRSNGNGILFADGTIHTIKGGQVAAQRHYVHPLLVLGFDVYAQPAEATIAQLREINIDLSKLHSGTWDGKPVYIVGANAGDKKSKQFWVEKDRLLFVRLLAPARDTTKTADTRFEKYQRAGQGWVSPQVDFLTDGKRTTLESYRDIKTGVALDPALFDAKQWATAKNWAP